MSIHTTLQQRADFYLLLLYIAVCATIVLRVSVEVTGYMSPDSDYYLEAASSLKNGHGVYIRDLYAPQGPFTPNKRIPFTAWPIGYPFLIFVVSELTPLDIFWAGKTVNLLFIGLAFLLIRHIQREHSYIIASIFGAFTILEVSSYTWSESIFMIGLLYLCYIFTNIYVDKNRSFSMLKILLASIFIFLIRYIGIIAAGAIFLAFVYYFWYNKDSKTSKHFLYVLLTLSLFISLYLCTNYYIAGYNTDVQRLTKEMESFPEVVWMALKGLAGELFLLRRYYFNGFPDWLTIAAASFQLILFYMIYSSLRKQRGIWQEFQKNIFSHMCLLMAGLYLLLLISLRSISQFDPINYRLLSPFTFLMLTGVIHYIVALPDHHTDIKKAKHLILALFLISLIINLPKEYILGKFINLM
ncbi:hypothetical protein FVR03_02540 [Pontibacter qinzhouensis]|uniref:Glycosyltransferase RgtA/B/C/D-like domain-containing protein n=1 Tax=Pontibacter qinzhouensis TaxID=2603253 RepID=A0A5C8KET9_9BACT|nr:hypothetical protein [Pontibacter qinzhouensis]TXK51979.1 hypothetical protein FVR03_02540 [Pontibacter qinzhouensis]